MGLKALADAVLAEVVLAAAAGSVILPELRYVAPGPFSSVSFDCDQVTVTVDLVQRGDPNEPVSGYVRLGGLSATITVAIVRLCMPTSEDEAPPLAADQAAAAATTLADLDLLWRNAREILDAGGCKHYGLAVARLLEIQGAAGGAMLTGAVDLLELGA